MRKSRILLQRIFSRQILSFPFLGTHKIWGILSQDNFSLGDFVVGNYVAGVFVFGAFVTGDFVGDSPYVYKCCVVCMRPFGQVSTKHWLKTIKLPVNHKREDQIRKKAGIFQHYCPPRIGKKSNLLLNIYLIRLAFKTKSPRFGTFSKRLEPPSMHTI